MARGSGRGNDAATDPVEAPANQAVEDAEEVEADGIEYGIPIPRVRSEHAWELFRHGGSKVVPKGASSSARKYVKDARPGWKVTERAIPGDDKNIRIWFTDPEEEKRIAAAGEAGGEDENPVETAE